MFAKIYNVLTALYCAGITLLGILTLVFPVSRTGLIPFDEQGYLLHISITIIFGLLGITAPAVALTGFYLAGGGGRNAFAHIAGVAVFLSAGAAFLLILYVAVTTFTNTPTTDYIDPRVGILTVPIGVLFVLNLLVFPLVFLIAALVAQKIALWKRFLPLIAFVLWILAGGLLAAAIIAVGAATGIESIYEGIRSATIPHWLMLGSIAWSVNALAAFGKNKTAESENAIHVPN